MKPSRLISSAKSSHFTHPVGIVRSLTPAVMSVTTISHRNRQSHLSSAKDRSPLPGSYTASEYTRKPDHVANTSSDNEDSYILTLRTDAHHHGTMTALRNKYFPKHINKLEAHISLFRALPGSKLLDPIIPDIESLAYVQTRFEINASTPFRLRQGIAVKLDKAGAISAAKVHRELKTKWSAAGFLSKQDNGRFQPHYTIQNKVDDEKKVEEAMEELESDFKGCGGIVGGLTLWKYSRGYWRKERDFSFGEPR